MRGFGSKNKSKTRVILFWRNLMIFDVLFGDIFGSLNEIILKICEDLPIGLSQLSEKLCGYWSWYSHENEAKDVALSCTCNIMYDNWISFTFFETTLLRIEALRHLRQHFEALEAALWGTWGSILRHHNEALRPLRHQFRGTEALDTLISYVKTQGKLVSSCLTLLIES